MGVKKTAHCKEARSLREETRIRLRSRRLRVLRVLRVRWWRVLRVLRVRRRLLRVLRVAPSAHLKTALFLVVSLVAVPLTGHGHSPR